MNDPTIIQILMEITSITMLNQLDASKIQSQLKVRIIHLWRLPSFRIPNATHQIELILMDEEGTKIQATVSAAYLRKFERFLVEQECILIQKPVMEDNLAKNPLLEHPHKLFFNGETHVAKCEDFVGSLHGFSFSPFDVLQSNSLPQESTVDVIGYVDTYFAMEDHKKKNGKIVKKMSLQLRDLENKSIFVTLWESYALKMDKFLSKKEDGVTTVMILQFGKFTFSGKVYINTAFQGSILFINDDIDEISNFKKSLMEMESNDSSSSRRSSSRLLMGSQSVTSVQDDFLTKTVYNSISEVNKASEVKSVIIMGFIISFPPAAEWNYSACMACNKKVTTDMVDGKKILVCPTSICNTKTISTVLRFKIALRVQDNTGVLSLTIFDREARKILNKTAKDMVDKIIDADGKSMNPDEINESSLKIIPKELQDLVGKKFPFKIDITNFNVNHNYKSFTVNKCTDDRDIISELEAKVETEEVDVSETNVIKSADRGSEDTINNRDSISYSGDNETPLSILDTSTKVDQQNEVGGQKSYLKRNLVELYDVDESPIQSATKPRKNLLEGPKEVSTPKLLVPKKEK